MSYPQINKSDHDACSSGFHSENSAGGRGQNRPHPTFGVEQQHKQVLHADLVSMQLLSTPTCWVPSSG